MSADKTIKVKSLRRDIAIEKALVETYIQLEELSSEDNLNPKYRSQKMRKILRDLKTAYTAKFKSKRKRAEEFSKISKVYRDIPLFPFFGGKKIINLKKVVSDSWGASSDKDAKTILEESQSIILKRIKEINAEITENSRGLNGELDKAKQDFEEEAARFRQKNIAIKQVVGEEESVKKAKKTLEVAVERARKKSQESRASRKLINSSSPEGRQVERLTVTYKRVFGDALNKEKYSQSYMQVRGAFENKKEKLNGLQNLRGDLDSLAKEISKSSQLLSELENKSEVGPRMAISSASFVSSNYEQERDPFSVIQDRLDQIIDHHGPCARGLIMRKAEPAVLEVYHKYGVLGAVMAESLVEKASNEITKEQAESYLKAVKIIGEDHLKSLARCQEISRSTSHSL